MASWPQPKEALLYPTDPSGRSYLAVWLPLVGLPHGCSHALDSMHDAERCAHVWIIEPPKLHPVGATCIRACPERGRNRLQWAKLTRRIMGSRWLLLTAPTPAISLSSRGVDAEIRRSLACSMRPRCLVDWHQDAQAPPFGSWDNLSW